MELRPAPEKQVTFRGCDRLVPCKVRPTGVVGRLTGGRLWVVLGATPTGTELELISPSSGTSLLVLICTDLRSRTFGQGKSPFPSWCTVSAANGRCTG